MHLGIANPTTQIRYLVVAGLISATSVLTPTGSARADSCKSAAACSRYVACFSGFIKTAKNRKWHCEHTAMARTQAPTCRKHEQRSDWRWSIASKKCYRTKRSGERVASRANIECPSGFDYNGSRGECEKPRHTIYALTDLSTSTVSRATPRLCASPSACSQTVSCPAGYARYTLGNKFYCTKATATATEPPTCRRHELRSDWRWSSSAKKCYRRRAGETVYTSENIKCPHGHVFNGGTGQCLKAGHTVYSTARMR